MPQDNTRRSERQTHNQKPLYDSKYHPMDDFTRPKAASVLRHHGLDQSKAEASLKKSTATGANIADGDVADTIHVASRSYAGPNTPVESQDDTIVVAQRPRPSAKHRGDNSTAVHSVKRKSDTLSANGTNQDFEEEEKEDLQVDSGACGTPQALGKENNGDNGFSEGNMDGRRDGARGARASAPKQVLQGQLRKSSKATSPLQEEKDFPFQPAMLAENRFLENKASRHREEDAVQPFIGLDFLDDVSGQASSHQLLELPSLSVPTNTALPSPVYGPAMTSSPAVAVTALPQWDRRSALDEDPPSAVLLDESGRSTTAF